MCQDSASKKRREIFIFRCSKQLIFIFLISRSQIIIKNIAGKVHSNFKEENILGSPKKAAATISRKYLNHNLLS